MSSKLGMRVTTVLLALQLVVWSGYGCDKSSPDGDGDADGDVDGDVGGDCSEVEYECSQEGRQECNVGFFGILTCVADVEVEGCLGW